MEVLRTVPLHYTDTEHVLQDKRSLTFNLRWEVFIFNTLTYQHQQYLTDEEKQYCVERFEVLEKKKNG